MKVTRRANGGMVSAPHWRAAQTGAHILAEGGTAIEAALAMAAMLTVVYPHMTGLGGDMFWLIAEPGSAPLTIDGAGRAGGRVTPALYAQRGLHAVPWRGALAANTVAGAVAAWDAAWQVNAGWGGRLALSRVLQDAVSAAAQGIEVTAGHADAIRDYRGELEALPGFSALHLRGGAPRAGDLLCQDALSRTLAHLADAGLDSFYRGALAQQMAAELAAAGAPLTAADLAAQRAVVGRPLSVALRMAEVYNCRPPSQGLASLMILGLYARLGVTAADTFAHVHAIVESTKQAFAVRNRVVGGHDAGAGLERYLGAQALTRAARGIDMRRAASWNGGAGDADTVWFGVIDREGRAVSAIQSLYFEFGSGIGLPASGFVWHNRGSAFQLAGGGPNVLAPGRKPFHTLNPALARFGDGRTMVYGAMGGDGQPQTQAAIFTRYAFHGMDLQCAISAPRWVLGRTWRDAATSLRIESRFPDALIDALVQAGHQVARVAEFDPVMGHAGAVVRLGPHAGYLGAADPRSDGAAVGC